MRFQPEMVSDPRIFSPWFSRKENPPHGVIFYLEDVRVLYSPSGDKYLFPSKIKTGMEPRWLDIVSTDTPPNEMRDVNACAGNWTQKPASKGLLPTTHCAAEVTGHWQVAQQVQSLEQLQGRATVRHPTLQASTLAARSQRLKMPYPFKVHHLLTAKPTKLDTTWYISYIYIYYKWCVSCTGTMHSSTWIHHRGSLSNAVVTKTKKTSK